MEKIDDFDEKSKYILSSAVDESCLPNTKGLGELLLEKMRKYRDKISQIDGCTLETQTYEDVLQRSCSVAAHMEERGVTSDDVISLCNYNTFDSCLPLLASIFLGAKISSLDPTLSSGDVQHLLGLVKPKIIFCAKQSVELIEKAILNLKIKTEIVVFGFTDVHTPFSSFLIPNKNSDTFQAKPVDLFDGAIIIFSSGTTGLAKGVVLTHYGLIYQQLLSLNYFDARVCLSFSTFYWISANILLIISILVGGARVICNKCDIHRAIQIILDCKVTYTFMAPFDISCILQNPNIPIQENYNLKCLVIGGGKLHRNQMEKIRQIFPNTFICAIYGSTEVSGYTTLFHPINDKVIMLQKPSACGKPLRGISYKIVNPETQEILGPNQPGELRIKSTCLFKEYYNNLQASESAWDKDGYFCTGDVLYYDEDHCFHFVERNKDVIKYQSWHVYPYEIESIILTHPKVNEAAVIGTPNEFDGEHPTAIVTLKHDAKITSNELIEYVSERVSDRKQLRGGVIIIESFPRTPTGKLRKKDLKKLL